MFNTKIYELEFVNGWVEEISMNSIIENALGQFDPDGWDTVILKKIIYFCSVPNVAVTRETKSFNNINGVG